MSLATTPLYFPNEVEHAVLMSAVSDFDLAQGASLVADPELYLPCNKPTTDDGLERKRVFGVTVLSLHRDGEVDFRTATFGINGNPALVKQVETMGSDVITRIGEQASATSTRLADAAQKIMMESLFQDVRRTYSCTLGGIAVVGGLHGTNTIQTSAFVSEALNEYAAGILDTRTAKVTKTVMGIISPRVRRNLRTLQAQEQFSQQEAVAHPQAVAIFKKMAGVAKKRSGGPVIVERQLFASI